LPFKELKGQPKEFIRVKKDGRVIISLALYRKHFKPSEEGHFFKSRVQVFIDEENKLIGFKPSEEGYKIMVKDRAFIKCSLLSHIVTGEFIPKWSDEHKMLIFNYGESSE